MYQYCIVYCILCIGDIYCILIVLSDGLFQQSASDHSKHLTQHECASESMLSVWPQWDGQLCLSCSGLERVEICPLGAARGEATVRVNMAAGCAQISWPLSALAGVSLGQPLHMPTKQASPCLILIAGLLLRTNTTTQLHTAASAFICVSPRHILFWMGATLEWLQVNREASGLDLGLIVNMLPKLYSRQNWSSHLLLSHM